MKNITSHLITALIATGFGSLSAIAMQENLYARTLASIASNGQPQVLASTSDDNSGYLAVEENNGERSILTGKRLSLINKRGEVRLSISIADDDPKIIFLGKDGKITRIIKGD